MYRTIELTDGWSGRIYTTQVYYSKHCALFAMVLGLLLSDVLDGAMITLAMYTLNFLHPGRLLYQPVERPL